jgi:hypothetical protein
MTANSLTEEERSILCGKSGTSEMTVTTLWAWCPRVLRGHGRPEAAGRMRKRLAIHWVDGDADSEKYSRGFCEWCKTFGWHVRVAGVFLVPPTAIQMAQARGRLLGWLRDAPVG